MGQFIRNNVVEIPNMLTISSELNCKVKANFSMLFSVCYPFFRLVAPHKTQDVLWRQTHEVASSCAIHILCASHLCRVHGHMNQKIKEISWIRQSKFEAQSDVGFRTLHLPSLGGFEVFICLHSFCWNNGFDFGPRNNLWLDKKRSTKILRKINVLATHERGLIWRTQGM